MTDALPPATSPSSYRPPERIRVLALALVRHPATAAVFVAEFQDEAGATFHRPAGGGIEFGETAEQALRREFREEFGAELRVGGRMAVIENLFTFNGAPGHEWIVLHEAAFVDEAFLGPGPFPVLDAPTDVGVWRPASSPVRLVPETLAGLLHG